MANVNAAHRQKLLFLRDDIRKILKDIEDLEAIERRVSGLRQNLKTRVKDNLARVEELISEKLPGDENIVDIPP